MKMPKICAEILIQKIIFVLLNMYSLSFSSLIAAKPDQDHFLKTSKPEHGELYSKDNHS